MTQAGAIVPVILSGGSGSRLWPVSRESFPKQLWPLISDRTMLQETALREGMRTLRQDGIDKVLAGQTTIDEVRATSNV